MSGVQHTPDHKELGKSWHNDYTKTLVLTTKEDPTGYLTVYQPL